MQEKRKFKGYDGKRSEIEYAVVRVDVGFCCQNVYEQGVENVQGEQSGEEMLRSRLDLQHI